ncbi:hypothetical protein NliqN6_0555 [Naganishia liquefaciens]|uniref:Uncharacterized protein n=1 Tax=Naganishia liquefaciens TaxID=104408 RepID=A0A8H3TNR0_9TREE|nr:hypothetical protein NliqN6_0555 [Naganishia liquefaciens]
MPRAKITLPTLLAQLPAYGQGSLVQPASWAERFPNSFYKITRTNLRVKTADGAGSVQYLARNGAEGVASGDVKGKAREEEDADMDAFGDDMEIGEVSSEVQSSSEATSTAGVDLTGKKAHGQAWGVLFWNGQPKFPYKHNWLEAQTEPNFTPQSKVRRALAESWKAVDPSSLSAETRTAVDQLETGKRRDWLARREKVKVENLSVKDFKGLEAWRQKQEQQV